MYSNIVVGTDGSETAASAAPPRHRPRRHQRRHGPHRQRLPLGRRDAGRHRGRALVRRQPHQDRCRARERRGAGTQQGTGRRDPRRRGRPGRRHRRHRHLGRRRRRRRRQQGDARCEASPPRQRPQQGRPPRPVHRRHRQDDVTDRAPLRTRAARLALVAAAAIVATAPVASAFGASSVRRRGVRGAANRVRPGQRQRHAGGLRRPRQQRSLDPPCRRRPGDGPEGGLGRRQYGVQRVRPGPRPPRQRRAGHDLVGHASGGRRLCRRGGVRGRPRLLPAEGVDRRRLARPARLGPTDGVRTRYGLGNRRRCRRARLGRHLGARRRRRADDGRLAGLDPGQRHVRRVRPRRSSADHTWRSHGVERTTSRRTATTTSSSTRRSATPRTRSRCASPVVRRRRLLHLCRRRRRRLGASPSRPVPTTSPSATRSGQARRSAGWRARRPVRRCSCRRRRTAATSGSRSSIPTTPRWSPRRTRRPSTLPVSGDYTIAISNLSSTVDTYVLTVVIG